MTNQISNHIQVNTLKCLFRFLTNQHLDKDHIFRLDIHQRDMQQRRNLKFQKNIMFFNKNRSY